MNRSLPLFAGVIGSFALSVAAIVLLPKGQIGALQPQTTEDEGKITDIFPIENQGIAAAGREVYAANGCYYCHSQQVRDPQNGTDLDRGWGERRTVARDYIFEAPPFLGAARFGPDLANVGSAKWRNEPVDEARKPAKRDAAWHLLHLYDPRAVITQSIMPSYRYLFEERKISGQRSADSLPVAARKGAEYEVVPTADAKTLVGYLLSLDRSYPLKEVKSAAAPAAAPAGAAPATK
jgi:cytochrome c oxidase cbb3-type subunit 2